MVNELTNVVHRITEKGMGRYPRFREETERIVNAHIRQREQKCKDNLLLYVEVQLSYMNTNHDDFIGFSNVKQVSSKDDRKLRVFQPYVVKNT